MDKMMLEIRELRAEIARLAALVEQMLPHQAEKTLWCDWMLEAIERAAVAEKTRENHRNCARHIREYDSTLRMCDLTPQLVERFERWLSEQGYKVNTVTKQMKIFRRYVNVAIDEELLSSDPFRKWHSRSEPTSKQALTERQLKKWELWCAECSGTEEEQLVARAFLFSCYTGLRYSDIRAVHWQDVKTAGRQKWLVLRMQKTKVEVRIPIGKMFGGKALQLIDTRGRLFPGLPVNSRTNVLIKRIARQLHIRKHLSFHCARVTCATILIHRGVPLTTIQQILGHHYIGTTQGYAHVTDSTVLKDVKRAWR